MGAGRAALRPRIALSVQVLPVEGGWHIEGYGFGLYVAAAGFTQTFRRPPVHTSTQTLSLAERGGCSFDETPAVL